MHPLTKPRAKIRRVEEQLKGLRTATHNFFEHNPYRIVVAELDAKTRTQALRLQSDLPKLPEEWSVYAGEIGHNVRSALDNLVCLLSRANDPAVDCSSTGFVMFLHGPRSTAAQRFRWDSVKLSKLTRDQRARIERAQPYKCGNGGQSNPLWHLHELNNADKHRIGLAAATRGHMIGIQLNEGGYIHGPSRLTTPRGRLKPNAKIGYIGDHMNVDFLIVPDVVFDQSGKSFDGLPLLPALSGMAQAAHEVIESFAVDFD